MKPLPFCLALVVLGGCGAADRFDGAECFRINDCEDDEVCFLAQCVDAGFTIGEVALVAAPPSTSGLLEQQLERTLDLAEGFQSIALAPTVTVTGAAARAAAAVPGTLIASTATDPDCDIQLPERPLRYRSSAMAEGFNLRAPSGRYLLEFVPDDIATLPPLLVHEATCGDALTGDASLELAYPTELGSVRGRLRATSAVTTGVADATVVGEIIDQGRVLRSNEAISDDNGEFTLFFPVSEIDRVTLVLGPGSENTRVPNARIEDLVPDETGQLPTQTLELNGQVELVSNLSGTRDGGSGTEPILDARVVYRGAVGPGTFSVTLDAIDSAQVSQSVPPGSYEVVVIPRQSQPFALTSIFVEVPAGEQQITVDVVLGRRVLVSGEVRNDADRPVRDARVSFFSRESPVSREFVTTTDGEGRYSLLVDPSIQTGDDAEYEVRVEPALDSAEPLLRELVRVSPSGGRIDFQLNATSFVFGRVTSPDGAVLPETLLSFFSRELTADGSPVFVGSARVSADGEFAFPLPSPDDP